MLRLLGGAGPGRFASALLAAWLLLGLALPAGGVAFERHVFATVDLDVEYILDAVGGSSPGGSMLAVAVTYYNGSTGLYDVAVVVENVSEGIPAVSVVRVSGSLSCDPAPSLRATAVEVGEDGRVYLAGYASTDAGSTNFLAVLAEGEGGYSLEGAVVYGILGDPIADLELADHPAYGRVLLAVGGDSGSHVPVVLVLNATDLSVVHALQASGLAWNKNYVDSAAVAMAGDGSILVAVTLSSQGHLALYPWSEGGYGQVYTVKYLNGLSIYDAAVWEGGGAAYAYVAGGKESDPYTDWGTGSDADPVLLKVPLDPGAWSEGGAIEWALAIDDSNDDYAYAAAVHADGTAAFAGYLVDQSSGLDYPFIALAAPNGTLASLAVAPSPGGGASQEARGSYHALSTYQGYTVAAGLTRYSNTGAGAGLLLYTPNISGQLNWTNAPPDWPNVTVARDGEALALAGATASLLDASAPPADSYSVSNASTTRTTYGCLQATPYPEPTVYTAQDNNTPTPIPEPGPAAALAALSTLAAAALLLRRRG